MEFGEGWICEKKRKKNGEMKKWGEGWWHGGAVVVMWRCLGDGGDD